MSIKPIDMQIMMPRTNEVSKISSDNQNKSHAMQQSTNTAVQHKVDDELNKVIAKDSVEKISIKNDQDKKRKERENQKSSKKKKSDENEVGSSIDIKI